MAEFSGPLVLQDPGTTTDPGDLETLRLRIQLGGSRQHNNIKMYLYPRGGKEIVRVDPSGARDNRTASESDGSRRLSAKQTGRDMARASGSAAFALLIYTNQRCL